LHTHRAADAFAGFNGLYDAKLLQDDSELLHVADTHALVSISTAHTLNGLLISSTRAGDSESR
jgi:hypothetical protein